MRFAVTTILCVLCWGCSGTKNLSQTDTNRRELFTVWNNLNHQEDRRNYSTICDVVDTVLQLSQSLPRHECRWYHAAAYLSRARAEARLDRFADARRDILLTLDSGYRNDALIRYDSILMLAVGHQWFDSIVTVWQGIQLEKQKKWKADEVVLLTSEDPPKEKQPLFIALHGGNGSHEEFSSHFLTLPRILKSTFAFPAGPIKYSAVCHSWPPQSQLSDSLLLSVIDSVRKTNGVYASNVYLLGYSQGAATAIGFSLRHPDLVKGTILFSGFTSEQFSDSVIQNASVHGLKFYAICAAADVMPFLSSMRDLSTRCKRKSIPFYYEERSGAIHGVPLDVEQEVVEAWHWFQSEDLGAK